MQDYLISRLREMMRLLMVTTMLLTMETSMLDQGNSNVVHALVCLMYSDHDVNAHY